MQHALLAATFSSPEKGVRLSGLPSYFSYKNFLLAQNHPPQYRKIHTIQYLILAHISQLPIWQNSSRHCKQPFLKQHHICHTAFAILIDISRKPYRLCCSSCRCCCSCGRGNRCLSCRGCSSCDFCCCLPFLTTTSCRFPLLHIGTIFLGRSGNFYILGIS